MCHVFAGIHKSIKREKGKWTLLDLEKLTKDLSEGQILELPEIYIGLHQNIKHALSYIV